MNDYHKDESLTQLIITKYVKDLLISVLVVYVSEEIIIISIGYTQNSF